MSILAFTPRVLMLRGVDGQEIDLCSAPYYAALGPSIYGAPPPAITATQAIGLPGSRFRQARWLARPLRIPIRLLADTRVGVDRAINNLANTLDPTVGDVEIVYTRPDGTRRHIAARYVGGLEGSIIEDDDALRSNGFTLNFTAHDPFWHDDNEVQYELVTVVAPLLDTEFDDGDVSFNEAVNFDGQTYGAAAQSFDDSVAFDDALTNFDGEAGSVQTFQASIGGDVTAYPNWTIEGPADSISLINSTNGRRFTLSTVVATGETVFIETLPGERIVTHDGVTIWDDVVAGSSFWGLENRKTNLISVAAENMVAGTSLVTMRWRERWLTC